MAKVWVARTANYESHIDDGPYGTEETWVPKDMWWEEVEMQETRLDFEAALAEALKTKHLMDTMPTNEEGDFTL
ncbi:hypothetical protein LCGC14_0660180 [marine sediment metagenome]|uniref:Uncharacterized protein n=1 Tax=marine sediment metagenome TaxID=412755 RepID=A0A0F9QTQ4_9ZZZZ